LGRTTELIHGEIVSKHRSIGLIRKVDTGKRPRRRAKFSDCSIPLSDRCTLGKRPESIPAALASECACLIKTNRINPRLSQVFGVALAKVAPWKSAEREQVG
jgi:hypothetical protein